MDILISSNLERLLYLTCGDEKCANYDENIEDKIIEENIKPVRKLDYTLQTPEQRSEFVRNFVEETQGQLSNKYLEILSDYIIFAMDKEERKKKSKTPLIEVQFIVFRHNEHQIKEIKKQGIEWGADVVSIKTAQIYNFNQKEELIPKNKKFSRYIKIENEWQLKKKQNNRCFRIFGGAVIAADGNVLPCCYDKSSTHTMGNVFNENFKNIWQGEQFTEFRKQVFYNRKQFEICKNCNE